METGESCDEQPSSWHLEYMYLYRQKFQRHIIVTLQFNRSFGQELVLLHTKVSMFCKFLVHAGGGVRSQQRTFYIGSMGATLKLSLTQMNRYRLVIVQTFTPKLHIFNFIRFLDTNPFLGICLHISEAINKSLTRVTAAFLKLCACSLFKKLQRQCKFLIVISICYWLQDF